MCCIQICIYFLKAIFVSHSRVTPQAFYPIPVLAWKAILVNIWQVNFGLVAVSLCLQLGTEKARELTWFPPHC